MKLKGIILCAIFVASICTQRVYASEYDVGFTHSEESQADDVTHGEESQDKETTHGEESQDDKTTHDEESQDEETTHGEESQDEETTHGEESQDEETTHSVENGEGNECSTDDCTDNNEDYEENTECYDADNKYDSDEFISVLDGDYIGDYRSFSVDTSPEDEIGYLAVIANTLTDMRITIIVQNIIICAFLIYIFVSRMTRVR